MKLGSDDQRLCEVTVGVGYMGSTFFFLLMALYYKV